MGAGAAYIGLGLRVRREVATNECIEFIAVRHARGGVRTVDER
jgi:hypothetical protein